MSAKIIIEYTDDTELQAILQRLQPVILRMWGPLFTAKSRRKRMHIKAKSLPMATEKAPHIGQNP